MTSYDLSTPLGRFKARWDYFWKDHAFLRRWFMNAHWLGPDLVRTNQPSPRQLAWWKSQGVKTVINLRGARDEAYYALEKDACARLGLTLIDAPLDSRDPPQKDRVHRAKRLFETIEYPVLIHCKSGADRAGIMAVLYRHFHLGEPIRDAVRELGLRTLHVRQGKTGVLDFFFETYLAEGAPKGLSFQEWVEKGYDRAALKAKFLKTRKSKLNVDELLRRE